jgi:kumamolisin
MTTIAIPGSDKKLMRGAHSVGAARTDERMEVTVRLRRKSPLPADAIGAELKPSKRTYLTHAQMETTHGADPADVAKVEAFAKSAGVAVVHTSLARRSVILSGTVGKFQTAFGVKLEQYEHTTRGTFRGRTGSISIPADLDQVVEGVFGLDNRPFAKSHVVRRRGASPAAAATAPFNGYAPPQVGKFYNFPPGDGTGQTIGIIELGGGYRRSDLTAYCKQINVTAPALSTVVVDHAKNSPTTADSADGEVMLDIEVAGTIAPKAKIVVYFAAGATDKDFLDVMTAAVHDTANNPSVISISWGGPEEAATDSFQTQFDQVLQSAAALGITVTVAAGDSGAADEGPNEWDGQAHVDFPGSSPHVLCCGGTYVAVSDGKITAESCWNQNEADTQQDSFGSGGGGVSTVFPLPSWQENAKVPKNVSTGGTGRGTPDVCGDGDPNSGYLVRVDGQEFPIGGTSAVAPLWAGLIAVCNQSLGHRAGFINALLYANPTVCKDVTDGSNKVGPNKVGYSAGPGWDACTGLGSPDGVKLLALLKG